MQQTVRSTISYPSHSQPRSPEWLQRLLWLEPLWLLLIAVPVLLPSLLPAPTQPLVVCALLAFWPLRLVLYKRGLSPFWGMQSSLALFMLWLPLTVWIAVDTESAWTAAGYTLLGIVLLVAACNHPLLRTKPLYLGWLLLLFGIAVLFVAPPLVQWKSEFRLFYIPLYDWFQRIPVRTAESIHANVLAGTLVQLCTISTAMALPPVQRTVYIKSENGPIRYTRIKWHRTHRLQRMGALLIALLLLTLLVLTQSRGAYLGLALALLMLCLLRWPRFLWGLPILGLAISLGVYHIGFSATFNLLGADNTFGGSEWRTSIWQAAGQALHDFAYTGIGLGNFRTVMPLLYPHPVVESDAATHAHHLLLQIGLDVGLIGLFSYALFMISTIWIGLKTIKQRQYVVEMSFDTQHQKQSHRRLVHQARRHNEAWALTAGAVAALVGIQVHGLLDAVTWGTKFAFLPWLICALIWLTATPSHTHEEQR